MEEELKDRLERIYNIKFTITSKTFRYYRISFEINELKINISHAYDYHISLNDNLDKILNAINTGIIQSYLKNKGE